MLVLGIGDGRVEVEVGGGEGMKSRASEVQENSLTVLNSLRRRKAQRAVITALTLRGKT